jgi:hypothetical protein
MVVDGGDCKTCSVWEDLAALSMLQTRSFPFRSPWRIPVLLMLLRETGPGGCVHRVLEKVPANLILDPVVRSESQDRKACELEDAEAGDNVEVVRTVGMFDDNCCNCRTYHFDECRALLCLATPY